jgi:hypothetical protein
MQQKGTDEPASGFSVLKWGYLGKNYVMLILLVIDVYFNAWVDSGDDLKDVITLICIQIVLRIMTVFVMFLMMWNTFVFKYGLLGAICSKFKTFFVIAPVSFLLMLAFRGVRISAKINKTSTMEIWEDDTYFVFYVLHNMCSVGYYVACVKTSFALGDPILYKPSYWLHNEN